MKYLLLFLAIISYTFAFGQWNESANWSFFRSPEKVNTIFEKDNEMWFGTENGLVVVDKSTLQQTIYTSSNSDLPSDDVKAIVDVDGSQFIGTYDLVLIQISGDDWTVTDIPVAEEGTFTGEDPKLYCLEADGVGNLWIGTNYGVLKYDGDDFEFIDTENINTFRDVWAIQKDENNNVFFSSHDVFQYDGENLVNLSDGIPQLFAYGDETRMYYDNGKLWYSVFGNDLSYFEDGEWTVGDIGSIHEMGIRSITTDSQGNLVTVHSYGQVYQYTNGAFELVNQFEHNIEKAIYSTEGNLWTSIDAAYYVSMDGEVETESFLGDVPFVNNTFRKMVADGLGNTYAINDYYYLVGHNDEIGWVNIELPEIVHNLPLNDLAVDHNNTLWVSSAKGLLRYTGSEWVVYSNEIDASVPFSSCHTIQIDSENKIWLREGGDKVIVYNHQTWMVHDNILGYDTYIKATEISPNNTLVFYASDRKLREIAYDGVITTYDISSVLSEEYGSVFDIHFDATNKMWIMIGANDNRVLFAYEQGQWEELDLTTSIEGYISLYSELENGDDGMYFTTTTGMVHIDEAEQVELISSSETLIPLYASNLMINQNGEFWMTSPNGLARFSPASITSNSHLISTPQVAIATWPNPANEKVVVLLGSEQQQELRMVVTNHLGQIIETHQIKTNTDYQLSVQHLDNGVYFIHTMGRVVQPIVIQH